MSEKNNTIPEHADPSEHELSTAIGKLSDNITQLSKMVMQLQRTLEQNKAKAAKPTRTSSCTIH